MLEIKNLSVTVDLESKEILHDFNLTINDGEIHAIMGPNGTGKSTLSKVIMGHYKYKIANGSITFNGKVINDLEVDERAKLGIFLAMQDPTEIEGVTTSEFLKLAYSDITNNNIDYYSFINKINTAINDLSLNKELVHRDLNKGFSGGEKKKNEILQLEILEPKFIILDEIDSGLDVDSLRIVAKNINKYKEIHPNTSILIITHYARILELIKPDRVHIMGDGKIKTSGDLTLALEIEKEGY